MTKAEATRLLRLLDKIAESHEKSWETLESDDKFWNDIQKARNFVEKASK